MKKEAINVHAIEVQPQYSPKIMQGVVHKKFFAARSYDSNEKADYLSKIVDFDDWTVKDCYFHAVFSYRGPCSLDCFASCKNCKFPHFYSKFFNPVSLGLDSLAFSWVGETCWLVSPVALVKNVIHHVCFCQCRGILIVPYWPSAPFWPILVYPANTAVYHSLGLLRAKSEDRRLRFTAQNSILMT